MPGQPDSPPHPATTPPRVFTEEEVAENMASRPDLVLRLELGDTSALGPLARVGCGLEPDPGATEPVDITAMLDDPWPRVWPPIGPLTPRPGLFGVDVQPRRRRIFTKWHRDEPTPGSRA